MSALAQQAGKPVTVVPDAALGSQEQDTIAGLTELTAARNTKAGVYGIHREVLY